MKKSIVLVMLFAGLLIASTTVEADEGNSNSSANATTNSNSDVFKGLKTAPENSPWDPREEAKPASDESGTETVSEEAEASADE